MLRLDALMHKTTLVTPRLIFDQPKTDSIEDHCSTLTRFPFDFLIRDEITEVRSSHRPVLLHCLTMDGECSRHLSTTKNDLRRVDTFVQLRSELQWTGVMIFSSVTNRRRREETILTNETAIEMHKKRCQKVLPGNVTGANRQSTSIGKDIAR